MPCLLQVLVIEPPTLPCIFGRILELALSVDDDFNISPEKKKTRHIDFIEKFRSLKSVMAPHLAHAVAQDNSYSLGSADFFN